MDQITRDEAKRKKWNDMLTNVGVPILSDTWNIHDDIDVTILSIIQGNNSHMLLINASLVSLSALTNMVNKIYH